MKIVKQLLILVATVLLISSCNKNEELAPELNSTFPADGVIRVATSVANPDTRAGMTVTNLAQFQVHIINESNQAYSYDAWMKKNVNEWESYEIGSVTDPTPLTLLWQNKTQPVKVTAVSDNLTWIQNEEWDNGYKVYVPTVQESKNAIESSDILYMPNTTINPTTDLVDEKIQINFNHRLSKLNLVVKMGTEFNKLAGGTTNNPITEVAIKGTYIKVLWKIIENTLSGYENYLGISPMHNSAEYTAGVGDTQQAIANYECILIPQTVPANVFEVSFTIGGRVFFWSSPQAVEFKADTQYDLSLVVGNEVVTVEGFSATPWTVEELHDIEME